MRTALLYADRNFVGPEYLRSLELAGVRPDLVVAVGRFSDEQIARERARTGGLWEPPPIPEARIAARFAALKDPALWALLRDHAVDVVIQGGIGIIKADMLRVPRIGFINVHPGRLPQYRGNSCPEWAVFNGDEIHLTAHLIDEGIDTGPVILSRPYDISADWSYEAFRANLYAQCGRTMAAGLKAMAAAGERWRMLLRPQDEAEAAYRPAMPENEQAQVRAAFPGWRPKRRFAPVEPAGLHA